MVDKTLFVYLTAFSKTGGIEQFNKNMMIAMHQLNINMDTCSLHDANCDENYFPSKMFKGFAGKKIAFLFSLFLNAKKYNTLIIGHINLSIGAYIFKKINPSIRIILIAHGVEVWKNLTGKQAWLLEHADQILSVSNFTKDQLIKYNPKIKLSKIHILPNSLDPFFNYPSQFEKADYLLKRYGLKESDKIILTIARLSSEEQYKGYDQVIRSLKELKKADPAIKYLLVGKGDELELQRIKSLIAKEQLVNQVILPGFVANDELIDHYLLADVFVLASKGEGFGIVLIEALACGRKVIAGNKDGSVDALLNGAFGTLIDPDDHKQISQAILNQLSDDSINSIELQSKTQQYFSFPIFKNKLNELLRPIAH